MNEPRCGARTRPRGLAPAVQLVPAHRHPTPAPCSRRIFYGTAGVHQGTTRLQQPSWRPRPPGEALNSVIWEGGQRGGGQRQHIQSVSGV